MTFTKLPILNEFVDLVFDLIELLIHYGRGLGVLSVLRLCILRIFRRQKLKILFKRDRIFYKDCLDCAFCVGM